MTEVATNTEKTNVPITVEVKNDASKDPLRIMIEILENEILSDEDKRRLLIYSQARFTNRRRMAYLALYAIILSLAFLLLATFIDGMSSTTILESIGENQQLFAWIEGFLAAIVAAYYGVSAWKPARQN